MRYLDVIVLLVSFAYNMKDVLREMACLAYCCRWSDMSLVTQHIEG